MRITPPYPLAGGEWGASALCIISDGFRSERAAWLWIVLIFERYIETLEAAVSDLENRAD